MARRPTSRHLALVGPTASGKSAVAMVVARRRGDVEIVTVDSMQVYRGMDVGTAKPSAAEQAEVPHHLLDLVDPDEEFTVARWQREARAAIEDIEARGHTALLVGGTGLYLRSVTDDLDIPGRWPGIRAELDAEADAAGPEVLHARLSALDPAAAARMEPTNRRRVVRALEVTIGSGRPFSSFGPGVGPSAGTGPQGGAGGAIHQVGLAVAPEELAGRIAARYVRQLDDGFVDEVRRLAAQPAGLSRTAAQALGYKELLAHLDGELSLDAAVDLAVRRTRRFARRQRAWFRRDPRIEWVTPEAAADHLLRGARGPAD